MDKLKELLNKIFPSISFDKKLHFLAGLLLCIIFSVIDDPVTGVGFSIAAGIFKECYDEYNDGKFDPVDMIATWVGGACGFAVVSLCKYWFG